MNIMMEYSIRYFKFGAGTCLSLSLTNFKMQYIKNLEVKNLLVENPFHVIIGCFYPSRSIF